MSEQKKDVSNGIVITFSHPADTRIEAHFTRQYRYREDGAWQEGYERRTLSMTINSQCDFVASVMDLKRAADGLGIEFGKDATLTVVVPQDSPLINGRQLCSSAADQLGWPLVAPAWFLREQSAADVDWHVDR